MMTLPNFEKKDITSEELIAEQNRLHNQADKMLRETGITDLFARYGKVSPIGGSYAYNLMVYPDLDMDIVVTEFSKQNFVKLASELIGSKFVRKVSAVDNVDFISSRLGTPKGYWLGIEIPFEGDKWGIDLWMQTKQTTQNFKDTYGDYNAKLSKLNTEQRTAVLSIKYHLIRMNKYGKPGFMSFDVYNAVLDNGIKSVNDFLAARH